MPAPPIRGRFLWHELLTTDPGAGAKFYTRVVGWKTESWPQNPSYSMFAARSGSVAGYLPLPEAASAMGAPPSWLSYIGTPDVDETVRHTLDLGGRALTDIQDVPGVGRFATLQDPQGAVFAVLTPSGPPRAVGDPPASGEFAWHELLALDIEAAFEFYRALFGWEKSTSMDMGPGMGLYQVLKSDGRDVGGMYNKNATMPAPPHWLPYAEVADTKAATKLALAGGARIFHGPAQVPGGGWMSMGMDPQGALFAVHSGPDKAAAKPAAKQAPAAKKPARKKPAKQKPAKKKPAARKQAGAAKQRPGGKKKRAGAKKQAAPRRAARKQAAGGKKKKAARKRAAPKRAARKAKGAKRKHR